MVTVSLNGTSYTEMLPVTDYNNYAMLDEKRTIKKKYWDKTTRSYKEKDIVIEAIDSFHVNTARKRCLAKAIALHGLGLHLYQKEEEVEETTREKRELTPDEFSKFMDMDDETVKRYQNSYKFNEQQHKMISSRLSKSAKTTNAIKQKLSK